MKKLLAFVLLLAPVAWTQGPFDGTWKLKLSGAQLEEKPYTLELQNGRYKCPNCAVPIDVKADGSDQSVPEAKSYDTLAVTLVNDKTVQFTRKKNGKVVSEGTDTVSDDAKTLTMQFKDYPPQGEPVTGKQICTRAGAGPKGAHAISGSWRIEKLENVSEQGLIFTFKSTDNGLSMSQPTGESYEAKFDGKDYPVKGDRANGTVSLKKINDTNIEETYKQDSKPVTVTQFTVEGNTLKYVIKILQRGTTRSFTAEKQ